MTTINNTYGRIETAEMIATAAIVFVRKARAEGYANKLNAEAIDGAASRLGIDPKRWTWSTAVRIVKANAKLMDETHLLDLNPAAPAEMARDEAPDATGIPTSTLAANLYAEDGDTPERAEFRRDMARMGGTSNEVSLAEWLPILAAHWQEMGGMEGAPEEFEALMARARTETRIAAFPAIADRLCALWRGADPADADKAVTTKRLQPMENPGDDWGCADCDAPDDDTWPTGSDVCNRCWDKAETEGV